ncbi:unnamed protein product [Heligmosomoides polygyrus]|uniref:Endo/exonuclease/phosphatase domain-containing protein n=1 Tax=Heligmosomoides polygyrus TaxID=6339 RepID=A0A183FD66_HELPZ|nr:unnamed protein product [Heligmosomoides polygyrus]
MVAMSVPPRGAIGICSLLRAKPNTDIRIQATGPGDRPAYEKPNVISYGCTSAHVCRDCATVSAGADAHSQSSTSVRSMRESLMRGRHRGATEPVRKPRNVSRSRVATLNVGTLTGRSCELVEELERRRVDFCAVQETRWSCCKSRVIERGFTAVLCGSPRTTSGVAIIVSAHSRDLTVSVARFDDRLMKIVVAAKEQLFHFSSAYATQTGCSDQAKDRVWSLLDENKAEVASRDTIIVAGDLNGHVGAAKDEWIRLRVA